MSLSFDIFEPEPIIVSGTGHRPHKLGGYSKEVQDKLRRFLVLRLKKIMPSRVLSGMALGFDQALAHSALELKIPFDAIIPFTGQEFRWPRVAQLDYQRLLNLASNIVVVSGGGYGPEKMQIRNEFMVDHCDLLLALWDGSAGGTKNCLDYAEKKRRETQLLWKDWLNAS
jgi:uncharacterized phage-like protein YoqJ